MTHATSVYGRYFVEGCNVFHWDTIYNDEGKVDSAEPVHVCSASYEGEAHHIAWLLYLTGKLGISSMEIAPPISFAEAMRELEDIQHDGANGSCTDGCRRCDLEQKVKDMVHDYCVNTSRYAYTVDV